MQNFPKWVFHRELPARIVQDAKELAALGEGWAQEPFPVEAPESAGELAGQQQADLAEQVAQLEKDKAEFADLVVEQAEALQAERQAFEKERDEGRAELAGQLKNLEERETALRDERAAFEKAKSAKPAGEKARGNS